MKTTKSKEIHVSSLSRENLIYSLTSAVKEMKLEVPQETIDKCCDDALLIKAGCFSPRYEGMLKGIFYVVLSPHKFSIVYMTSLFGDIIGTWEVTEY